MLTHDPGSLRTNSYAFCYNQVSKNPTFSFALANYGKF